MFDEYHNNIIEFGLTRNGHEFQFSVDERAISILVDEETNCPTEIEIRLANVASVDEFYEMINKFVGAHS